MSPPRRASGAPGGPSIARRTAAQLGFAGLLVLTWTQGHSTGPAPDEERFAGVSFRDVAPEVGLSFRHEPPVVDDVLGNVAPHVTAVGAAVSVLDADADGSPDVYVTSSSPEGRNALFRNHGDGTFEDVAARAGVAEVNRPGTFASMGSIWADLDGDGLDDGMIYGWGENRVFRNAGDLAFEDVSAAAGLAPWVNSNTATFLDYDRDGDLDLYVGGYFGEEHDLWHLETTRILTESFEFATNAAPNRLYHGRGDGTFEEVEDAGGAASTRWTFAITAADFDRDGWVDLYLANDYGPEELFLNRAGERFEPAGGLGLRGESKSGMAVALGDVLGEGRPSVFVTNISKRGYLFQGNNLRVAYGDSEGDLMLLQLADGPVADCGWAWGAQFGDLDHDGLDDLVVANGFISASTERDYWYQMSKIGGATGELIRDAANWPPIEDRSLSGYERTRVLFNRGNGRFVEAGELVGIDDVYDGRAVALADLEGDGDLDVLLANQAGPLLAYRNESSTGRHWIAFELRGTGTNTSAIGAEVEIAFATADGETQRRVRTVTAASGFSSQNERRPHFGLGDHGGPVSATVRWPSGGVTELEDLEPDRVHRVEESP